MRNLAHGTKRFFKKNGATILSCMGVAGVVGTTVVTAKSAIKASQILEVTKQEKGENLTTIEKLKVAAPIYIPSILLGASTVACILGANVLNKRQQASLVAGYTLLNTSFKEYRNKVIDIYGEEAHEKVEEAIKEDHAISQGDETVLFFDQYSQRFFESTLFKVQQAEYYLNRELVMRDWFTLNEWYDELGLDIVDAGDVLGWSTEMCLQAYWQSWVDFNHNHKVDENGRKYIEISFWQTPVDNFEDYL